MARTQRAWLGFVLVVAVLGIVVACLALFFSKKRLIVPTEDQCRILLKDIESTVKVPGANPRYLLPKSVAPLSFDGFAQVVVGADGRIVALLKSISPWRGNYEGWVITNTALRTQDLSRDYYGREIIVVPSLDLVAPVIRSKHSETLYEVCFDLD